MITADVDGRLVMRRTSSNLWWLCLTDTPAAADVLSDLQATSMPSQALTSMRRELGGSLAGTALVAKLELDVCGAWLTVANASPSRPVVVRRAGWVDLRGHPGHSLPEQPPADPTDDRVGLGPGDVLVLHLGSDVADAETLNDDVVDACLAVAGDSPRAIAAAVHRRVGGQVAAIGVPDDLGADPLMRVAAATGTRASEVQSPGYPLGDLQPDLWRQPPRPPRLARVRLSADRSSARVVRSLLDRLLASWRLDGRIDPDDVKLVATELAANAVVHSGAPETVTVRYRADAVRIEVTDRSPRRPEARSAGPDAEGGRGLQLIEALGSAWGTEQLEDGKRVWCDLAVN